MSGIGNRENYSQTGLIEAVREDAKQFERVVSALRADRGREEAPAPTVRTKKSKTKKRV